MKTYNLMIILIIVLLISSCSSSYKDCFNNCYSINYDTFKYDTLCKNITNIYQLFDEKVVSNGYYNCSKLNKTKLKSFCHIDCKGGEE